MVQRHFLFLCNTRKKGERGEKKKNPQMLKREREILPAVVLGNPGSQSAPLFCWKLVTGLGLVPLVVVVVVGLKRIDLGGWK